MKQLYNFNQIISAFKDYISLVFSNDFINIYRTRTGIKFILFQESKSKPITCIILNFIYECTPHELIYFSTNAFNIDKIISSHDIFFEDLREIQFDTPISKQMALNFAFGLLPISISDETNELLDHEVDVPDDYDLNFNFFSDYRQFGDTYFTEDNYAVLPMGDLDFNDNKFTLSAKNFIYFNENSFKYSNFSQFNSVYLSNIYSNHTSLSVCVNPYFFSKYFMNIINEAFENSILELKENYNNHTLFVIPSTPSLLVAKYFNQLLSTNNYVCTYFYHNFDQPSIISLFIFTNNILSFNNHLHFYYSINDNFVFSDFFFYPDRCNFPFTSFLEIITELQRKYTDFPISLTPKINQTISFPPLNIDDINSSTPSPLYFAFTIPLIPELILDYCKHIFNYLNINFHFREI